MSCVRTMSCEMSEGGADIFGEGGRPLGTKHDMMLRLLKTKEMPCLRLEVQKCCCIAFQQPMPRAFFCQHVNRCLYLFFLRKFVIKQLNCIRRRIPKNPLTADV